MAPIHYLNQCWNIVNWTLRNKLQWNFNCNSNIFIEENMVSNVVHFISASMWWELCSTIYRIQESQTQIKVPLIPASSGNLKPARNITHNQVQFFFFFVVQIWRAYIQALTWSVGHRLICKDWRSVINVTWQSGPHLNIKTIFSGTWNSIIKIRQSWDHVIFIIGIPILLRWHPYIGTGLGFLNPFNCFTIDMLYYF